MSIRYERLLIAVVGLTLLNGASAQRSPTTAPPDSGGLLLSNVRVFDPASGTFTPPIDILVRDGRIASTGTMLPAGRAITRIDGAGRYALPGLWDSHVHFSFLTLGGDSIVAETLEAFARNGITSVRDVGGPLATIAALRTRVDEGNILGPSIYFAGPMLTGAPVWEFLRQINGALAGFVVVVASPAELDTLLDRLAAHGASMTKAVDRWDATLLRYYLRAAKARSLRVVWDAGLPILNPVPIDTALALGVTSIEHAKAAWSGVLRDDLAREVQAFMTSGKDYGSGEELMLRIMTLGERSVSHDRLAALADTWARSGSFFSPTLLVAVSNLAENPPERYRRPFEGLLAVSKLFARELSARGVRLLVGQDQVQPDGTWKEMEALAAAGVSNVEILRGATIYPAQFLGLDDSVGTLTRGRRADIVILEANPLERIENIRSVWKVVRHGKVIPDKSGQ
jgi:hypothetical protein